MLSVVTDAFYGLINRKQCVIKSVCAHTHTALFYSNDSSGASFYLVILYNDLSSLNATSPSQMDLCICMYINNVNSIYLLNLRHLQ